MARFFASVIFAFLAVSMLQIPIMAYQGQVSESGYGPGSLKSYECPSECTRRCSKTQYHKACMMFCEKCCMKCLCVPPGYYGNKHLCPCYDSWKTKEGGPKCP